MKNLRFGLMIFALLMSLLSMLDPTKTLAVQAAPADELTAAARQFIEALVKEDYAAAGKNFDETMKSAMPEGKTRELWEAIKAQFGAFKQQGAARREKLAQYDIIFITCEFERAALAVKVVFDPQRRIAGVGVVPVDDKPVVAPPPYAKPDSYTETEVTVGTGEWALPGTLTMPKGAGPFAAVVLVHGSGPNDRDESAAANKPFRDLAWGLASQGIAVLRYDKRTKTHASKFAPVLHTFTVKEEAIDDALAAVALLRKTANINPKKLFVAGHSLGGMLIPRIGAADSTLAGLIVLAGTTRPLEDVITEQYTYIFSLDGQLSDAEQKQLDKARADAAKIKALKEGDTAMVMGGGAKYWLDLRGYDPPTLAKTLPQPLLILQGEKDYQVTMQDFANWKKALADRKDVTFKSYAKLYHLFIETEERPAPSNYNTPGHVASYVIDDIARWVKRLADEEARG